MPSIPDTLRYTAARCPEREALVFGDRRGTYRDLHAEVERVAAALAARGLSPGDRALLISPNSDHFVVAAYAVLRTGAILVPVNPRSAPPELAHLITDSGATVLLHAPELADVVARGVALVEATPTVLALGAGSPAPDLIALAATETSPPVTHQAAEADDALLLYTSGTTGRPKGALFDHHRALWVGFNLGGTCGYRDGDRVLHVAPLYHAAELTMMLFPGTVLAMTHVVLPGFEPVAVADTLDTERISLFFGVPTMYQFLLRLPDLTDRDLSAWRVGLFGAAPMPADTVSALVKTLPDVELYQLCGQTEAGPGGIYAPPADVAARPDASGRYALPNTECRVATADGADVAPGEVGELLLRGETVMKGYWNQPEATAETIRDGWLHTGDLARLDADGYITLVDRLKDMIITGARNVYSVEVENALAGHPDIADVAVIGVPHPDYGESILAVVAPREGAEPTLESLRTWCRDRIADYKHPHALAIHPIPRNPSGKIQKHLLRAELSR
jgi:acyl-CoA synthetase (AMP-forming)/AMP-acid ligase II